MRKLLNYQRNHRYYLCLTLAVSLISCVSPSVPIGQVVVSQTIPQTFIPAFPGAEGYGAQSIGGRGGRVIEVTTLNDSGPGSLRAAIDAVGPRIVVFRVGGTIELFSPLVIKNSYITIAGQSAPGGGIALKSHETMDDAPLEISAEHVVIRHIRSRPGPMTAPSHNIDALIISRDAKHIMIDHSSFSWASDENISVWYNASNITIQWSIISEALLNSTHDAGPQGYGILIGDKTNYISLHHNLLAHNYRRNPRVTGGHIDIINNVIYNAGSTPSRLFGNPIDGTPTGGFYNYIGNYIKAGPNSEFDYEIKLESLNGGPLAAFIEHNIGPNRVNETVGNQVIVNPDGRSFLVSTSFPLPFVTTTSAEDAYDEVLASAGATLPLRDDADKRLIAEVGTKTGRIIDNPTDVGGWPLLTLGTAPADKDHDGMPDSWEIEHKYEIDNPVDGSLDSDGDGYTNVEEFLNNTDPNRQDLATATTYHIGELFGTSTAKLSTQQWSANVHILIEDARYHPLPNSLVTGIWNNNDSDIDSCITDENGRCSIEKSGRSFLPQRTAGAITFLVTNVKHGTDLYDSTQNRYAIPDQSVPQPGVRILQPLRLFMPYVQYSS